MEHYDIAAFYVFAPLAEPASVRAALIDLASDEDLRGTTIVADEGLNGTMAGSRDGLDRYMVGACAPRFGLAVAWGRVVVPIHWRG